MLRHPWLKEMSWRRSRETADHKGMNVSPTNLRRTVTKIKYDGKMTDLSCAVINVTYSLMTSWAGKEEATVAIVTIILVISRQTAHKQPPSPQLPWAIHPAHVQGRLRNWPLEASGTGEA